MFKPSRILGASLFTFLGFQYADSKGWVREWRIKQHAVAIAGLAEPTVIAFRYRCVPPPIGLLEWPAGRILLQLAVDGGIPLQDACVLEIGSGSGTTAVGFQKAITTAFYSSTSIDHKSNPTTLIATDVCHESLQNLMFNARLNNLEAHESGPCKPNSIRVCHWNATGGDIESLPAPVSELTHVIGADVAYFGGPSSLSTDRNDRHLVKTISELLAANPRLSGKITLLLVDRFSGPSVAAVSQLVGVGAENMTPLIDPAIQHFENECVRFDLHASREYISDDLQQRILEGLSSFDRFKWMWFGNFEGMYVYRISRPSNIFSNENQPGL
jgi:hypothetical protein